MNSIILLKPQTTSHRSLTKSKPQIINSRPQTNKKAQLVSQVFVYVISALVFILILFFGYRMIFSLGEKQEKVLLFQFQQDLVAVVDGMRMRYGSVDIVDFKFPKSFSELCFVTDKSLIGADDIGDLKNSRPGLHSLWVSGEYNVFSLPSADVRIKIPGLDVKKNGASSYCCFPVAGKLSLRLEGAGKTVVLSSGDPGVYTCEK